MLRFVTRAVLLAACLALPAGNLAADEPSLADLQKELQALRPTGKSRVVFLESAVAIFDKIIAHPDAPEAQKDAMKMNKLNVLGQIATLDKSKAAASVAYRKACVKEGGKVGLRAEALVLDDKLFGDDKPLTAAGQAEILAFAKAHPEELYAGVLAANALEALPLADAKKFAAEAEPIVGSNASFKRALKTVQSLGKPMPIVGPTLAGSEFNLETLKGKVVLVDFWATWCGPCIQELPNVKEVYAKYHGKGFEIVGVSLDRTRGALETFVKKNAMPWPQVIFEKEEEMFWKNPVAKQYGINSIPAMYLIGADGTVQAVNCRGPKLEKAVKAALAKAKAGSGA